MKRSDEERVGDVVTSIAIITPPRPPSRNFFRLRFAADLDSLSPGGPPAAGAAAAAGAADRIGGVRGLGSFHRANVGVELKGVRWS